MTKRTRFILKTINIIFWVIFIGLCIKTGTILVLFFESLFVNPATAKNLDSSGLNLFNLYTYSKIYYGFIVSFIIILTGLEAYVASLVVKIFMKFSFIKPFNSDVLLLVDKIVRTTFIAAIVAIGLDGICGWLNKKGVIISQDWNGDGILFFAGIIYIIAEVFKKGIALQHEQDLTV